MNRRSPGLGALALPWTIADSITHFDRLTIKTFK
jgi:hypothetical protein